MENKKAQLNIWGIIILIIILFFLFGGFNNLASIILLDTEDTFYQYAGLYPREWQRGRDVYGSGWDTAYGCYNPVDMVHANIQFSDNQIIKVDEYNFEFKTYDVNKINANNGLCSGVSYRVSVFKDGVKIDEVIVPSMVESCSDLIHGNEGTIPRKFEKQYDSIEATFGFAYENYYSSRCGEYDYVVHQYKLIKPKIEEPQQIVIAPENNKYVEVQIETIECTANVDCANICAGNLPTCEKNLCYCADVRTESPTYEPSWFDKIIMFFLKLFRGIF